MPRSPVLTGRIDARDRAQTRGRHDRPGPPAPRDAHVLLRTWLADARLPDEPRDVARLDLDAFLRDTALIELPAEERLRQLAIHLESRVPFDTDVLDRIYQRALALAPDDPRVWLSRGITAQLAAEPTGDESVVARASQLALRSFERALALAPGEPPLQP
jgi:hypothetical protein